MGRLHHFLDHEDPPHYSVHGVWYRADSEVAKACTIDPFTITPEPKPDRFIVTDTLSGNVVGEYSNRSEVLARIDELLGVNDPEDR